MCLVSPEGSPSEENRGISQSYSTDFVNPSLKTASMESTDSFGKVSIILSEISVPSSNHP